MKFTRAFFLWTLLLLTSWVYAAPCTVIRAENIFDGQNWTAKKPQRIAIQDGVIAAVLHADIPLPSRFQSCSVIDIGTATLTPGLIDLHTHLLLTDHSFGEHFSAELARQQKESMSSRMKKAKVYSLSLLNAGVTSVRDLGNSGRFQDIELRRYLEKNLELGPRMFLSGPGFAIQSGQFDVKAPEQWAKNEYEILTDKVQILARIQSFKAKGVDWIKLYSDHDPAPQNMDSQWIESIVNEAHRLNLPVAAHATNNASALVAINAGVDSLEHGYELDEKTLTLMAQKKITLVATDWNLAVCTQMRDNSQFLKQTTCKDRVQLRGRRLTQARDLKVPIAFGSDMYYQLKDNLSDRGRATIESLIAYQEEGLTPLETLQAATMNAATVLKRSDLGRIQVGAHADLVAFSASPIEDIQNLKKVFFVMKEGRVIRKK